MSDWYNEAFEAYIAEVAEYHGLDVNVVKRVYAHLVEDGLIDYDIEKEFLADWYENEEVE